MADLESKIIVIVPHTSLPARLAQEIRDSVISFLKEPGSYFQAAFYPNSHDQWFLVRLANQLRGGLVSFVEQPAAFIKGAMGSDLAGMTRRWILRWTLVGSLALHSVLLGYLFYAAVIAPFLHIKVVEKPYKQIDVAELLKPLKYPSGMLKGPERGPNMSIEEIRENDRKKREERERRKREEEARRKAEEENETTRQKEEEVKKAEEAKKAEAAKVAEGDDTNFGEINVTPIRDIIGKIYEMYNAGQLEKEADNFSLMCDFRILSDGSIGEIHVTKSSGMKLIDTKGIEVLHNLGESHGLKPLKKLSSNSIRLEVSEDFVKLSITSFAPTSDEAKRLSGLLSDVLSTLAFFQKKQNPGIAELLRSLKVSSNNKRVDAILSLPRSRVSEMMRAQFVGAPSSPQ